MPHRAFMAKAAGRGLLPTKRKLNAIKAPPLKFD